MSRPGSEIQASEEGEVTTASRSQPEANTIDDMPLSSFHRKLTVYSAGGPFLDGYVLGIIAVALAQITPQWGLSDAWQGLLAAGALVGLFVGGFLGGYITDKIGRTMMYTLDLILVAVCSVAQFFVEGPIMLLALRFLIGIAVGADYPIATSLLAEFAPRRKRGGMLGWLTAMWAAGNAVAYVVGDLLSHLGPDAWRWMLLSPVIPAVVLVLGRWGTPESPRWLASRGRTEEALAALRKVFGPAAQLEVIPESTSARPSLRSLFSGLYGKRTLFIIIFWSCSILPIYAIYAFGPALLQAFHLSEPGQSNIGESAIGLLFFIGCVLATLAANRFTRRQLLVIPFAIATVALFGLGIFPNASGPVIVILFAVYAISIGGPTILQWIYPNELFPTEIRATAVGLGTSISRIGAAAGTFFTPILLTQLGVGLTMLIAACISAIGAVACFAMAPETSNKSLSESSNA